jgi:hypothetical protein
MDGPGMWRGAGLYVLFALSYAGPSCLRSPAAAQIVHVNWAFSSGPIRKARR